jgi:hypothetical protein
MANNFLLKWSSFIHISYISTFSLFYSLLVLISIIAYLTQLPELQNKNENNLFKKKLNLSFNFNQLAAL